MIWHFTGIGDYMMCYGCSFTSYIYEKCDCICDICVVRSSRVIASVRRCCMMLRLSAVSPCSTTIPSHTQQPNCKRSGGNLALSHTSVCYGQPLYLFPHFIYILFPRLFLFISLLRVHSEQKKSAKPLLSREELSHCVTSIVFPMNNFSSIQ